MFNEQARDEIAGAVHKGNNVDIAQRYAQSEADEKGRLPGNVPSPSPDQAEKIVNDIRLQNPYWSLWSDPVALKRFTDELRMSLSGQHTTPEEDARLRQESPEEPFSSEKFFSNPAELEKAAKQVRPKRL